MSEQKRVKATAYHEASHAVARLLFRWKSISVHVYESGGVADGFIDVEEHVLRFLPEHVIYAISSMASGYGEKLIQPKHTQFSLLIGPCRHDFGDAYRTLRHYGINDGQFFRLVNAMMRKNAIAVKKLAEALSVQRRMTYEKVCELISNDLDYGAAQVALVKAMRLVCVEASTEAA